MHKVTINLTKQQVARLKELSSVTGTPYAQYIRRAIDDWLLQHYEATLKLHRRNDS